MGKRGPKPRSALLQAQLGNPGHAKLGHDGAEVVEQAVFRPTPIEKLDPPDFLTHERERAIFTRAIDFYLQRRLAHKVDVNAYARWAHNLHRWIECKEALDGEPTWIKLVGENGAERLVRHPAWRDYIELDRMLNQSEDRLGLNPASRQSIIRGLAAMPSALAEVTSSPGYQAENAPKVEVLPPSPIGFGRVN